MQDVTPLNPPIEGATTLCPQPMPNSPHAHGFVDCLAAVAPLIKDARERVRRGAAKLAKSHSRIPFDVDTIDETLASHLGQQLTTMMARVFVLELNVARLEGVLEGRTPEERFNSFIVRL